MSESQQNIKPAHLFRAGTAAVTYRQRFTAPEANLTLLNCGEFELAAHAAAASFLFPERESLLYQWKGTSTVQIAGSL